MTTTPAAGLALIGYQDAITAQIISLYPDYEVIEDTLDDDRVFYRDTNGKFEEFIVLRYGPLIVKRNGKSMAGVRHDEYVSTVDILAVSPNGRKARFLCAAIVDDMMGFKPGGGASMGLRDDGGAANAFVVAQNEARPSRQVAAQRMQFTVNDSRVGTSMRDLIDP